MFLVDSPLRPLSRLSGQKNGNKSKKSILKSFFSLVDNPLPPHPLSGLSTKKTFFFAVSLS